MKSTVTVTTSCLINKRVKYHYVKGRDIINKRERESGVDGAVVMTVVLCCYDSGAVLL